MGKILTSDDITGYTPTQHYLQPETSIDTKSIILDRAFDAQSSNVDRILKNNLELSEAQMMDGKENIPMDLQEKIFNGVAQLELQKQIANMRGDKFSLDMDQVPLDEPKFK